MKTVFDSVVREVSYAKMRELKKAAAEVRKMGEGMTMFERNVAKKQLEIVEKLLLAAEAI